MLLGDPRRPGAPEIDRERNLVERFFRRIATRYDKFAEIFLSLPQCACASAYESTAWLVGLRQQLTHSC